MDDPKTDRRFHRIVGWAGGVCFLLLVATPITVVAAIGECLPRDAPGITACDAERSFQLIGLLIGSPIMSAAVGWLMFRYSIWLDAS